MPDLTTPLSDEELVLLDQLLLNRFEEDAEPEDGDEGVLDVSELDGLLTAIVSLPELILPSQWWPVMWGDFPPVFESEDEVRQMHSLIFRHMNVIASTLMVQPDDFEPLFLESHFEGRVTTIVDEWCEGFMRGVTLAQSLGTLLDDKVERLMFPIRAFTQAADWPGRDVPEFSFTEDLQQLIAPNVRALHAHWLQLRQSPAAVKHQPFRRSDAPVGRNEPCPCGSGKKFKKCCLH